MSWLPGINPDQLTEPTARIRFNADATAALAQWHGQSATYFEDVDGARYATFTDAYAAFVAARQAWLAAHPEKKRQLGWPLRWPTPGGELGRCWMRWPTIPPA